MTRQGGAPFRALGRGELRPLVGEQRRGRHERELSETGPFALTPLAFLYPGEGWAALYHSATMAVVYGDGRLEAFLARARAAGPLGLEEWEALLGEGAAPVRKLVREGFLIPAGADPYAPVLAMRRDKGRSRATVSLLYLLVTNDCNLRCRYCNIEGQQRKPEGFGYSAMPLEMARRGIDLYLEVLDDKALEPTIIFYGGEPLLNRETFFAAAAYIREKQAQGAFGCLEPSITAVLNGTLITEDVAKRIGELGIGAAVSIDGLKHHHDRMRVYRGGGGTWEDAVKGYYLLKKHAGGAGISCTLAGHNYEEIEEIAEFFATRLECRGLGFNILKGHPAGNTLEIPAGAVTRKLIAAFEIFRRYGIYEDRVMRKVGAFTKREPWYYDCGGYGGQLALCADGSIGPCHVAADDRRFLWGRIDDEGLAEKILRSDMTLEWCRRAPMFYDECRGCEALAICGGGCADEAFVKEGSIHAMDRGFCEHSKVLLRWMIEDLALRLEADGAWILAEGAQR